MATVKKIYLKFILQIDFSKIYLCETIYDVFRRYWHLLLLIYSLPYQCYINEVILFPGCATNKGVDMVAPKTPGRSLSCASVPSEPVWVASARSTAVLYYTTSSLLGSLPRSWHVRRPKFGAGVTPLLSVTNGPLFSDVKQGKEPWTNLHCSSTNIGANTTHNKSTSDVVEPEFVLF